MTSNPPRDMTSDRFADEDESPVEIIDRQRAVRRIAALIANGRHHLIAASTRPVIIATAELLRGLDTVAYLDEWGRMTVTVIPNLLNDDVRAALATAEGHFATITVIPADAITPAALAELLDHPLTPGDQLGIIHRRPTSHPDRPPLLLREALQRLAAHQRSTRRAWKESR